MTQETWERNALLDGAAQGEGIRLNIPASFEGMLRLTCWMRDAKPDTTMKLAIR